MEEEIKTKYMNRAINEEILDKLSLKNRYAFLNTNLMTVIQEIVGGSRQIQQYILSMALRQIYKMSGI